MSSAARVPRVVVCGGGVAGAEALLALRALAGDLVELHLVSPTSEFAYQPLAVAAPFGLAETHRFDLADLARDVGAELHEDMLALVDVDGRCVRLQSGTRLHYDAVLVAVGPQRRRWLDGALHFGGAADVEEFTRLLESLVDGSLKRLAFVQPDGVSWPLPVYELALLTAWHLGERGVDGVELTVVTPEIAPLSAFGPGASELISDLLSARGITLLASTSARSQDGRVACGPQVTFEGGEVLALCELEGPGVPGLACDAAGFIEVDEHARVAGLRDVYAAGDGTNFPVKQGGIATQQADAAAEMIAASFGAELTPSPMRPTLRAMVLSGIAPLYLRAQVADAAGTLEMAGNPLWMPPAKVAGSHLAPYLDGRGRLAIIETLEDRAPSSEDPSKLRRSHDEARELALSLADRDALEHDYGSALHWLDALERLDGVLPPEYLAKRELWRGRLGGSR